MRKLPRVTSIVALLVIVALKIHSFSFKSSFKTSLIQRCPSEDQKRINILCPLGGNNLYIEAFPYPERTPEELLQQLVSSANNLRKVTENVLI